MGLACLERLSRSYMWYRILRLECWLGWIIVVGTIAAFRWERWNFFLHIVQYSSFDAVIQNGEFQSHTLKGNTFAVWTSNNISDKPQHILLQSCFTNIGFQFGSRSNLKGRYWPSKPYTVWGLHILRIVFPYGFLWPCFGSSYKLWLNGLQTDTEVGIFVFIYY